jgi:hypothetical protein
MKGSRPGDRRDPYRSRGRARNAPNCGHGAMLQLNPIAFTYSYFATSNYVKSKSMPGIWNHSISLGRFSLATGAIFAAFRSQRRRQVILGLPEAPESKSEVLALSVALKRLKTSACQRLACESR